MRSLRFLAPLMVNATSSTSGPTSLLYRTDSQ
uniref:Uncharacterized protein n=1 Tax=Anguilla anguilla TaxID=7936 RepID=A0A0E9T8P2_ANGAN